MKELFRRRDTLYAVANVGSGLLEAVKKGHYKHVSASFSACQTGGWNLRHVGFLGAHPPAVKGLASLNFGEVVEPPGAVCFASPTGSGRLVRPEIRIPAGWTVTPEGLAHYLRAVEIEAGCPGLSFAECATLASEYYFES